MIHLRLNIILRWDVRPSYEQLANFLNTHLLKPNSPAPRRAAPGRPGRARRGPRTLVLQLYTFFLTLTSDNVVPLSPPPLPPPAPPPNPPALTPAERHGPGSVGALLHQRLVELPPGARVYGRPAVLAVILRKKRSGHSLETMYYMTLIYFLSVSVRQCTWRHVTLAQKNGANLEPHRAPAHSSHI